MATQYEHETETSMTQLISGIVQDAQELVKQQLQLFQVELRNDLRRTRDATLPLAVGAVAAGVGGLFLLVTAALWISWQWPETIPLWGAFGIVTGVVILGAAIAVGISLARFRTFNPLPDKTLEGIKETVQWKTKT